MDILVAKQEQLDQYSRRRISNASLLRTNKRKSPDAMQCGSTKTISENDNRNDGCPSHNRARTASKVEHFSGEVESSNEKTLSKMQWVDSRVMENFHYVLSDDELEEDEELKFLLKLKGRKRNSDCETTDKSSKDKRIENCQTRNIKLFTSSSSPPFSTTSSLNKNTRCAAQNTKVIVKLLSVRLSCLNLIIISLYLTGVL